jgi:hypothetical protein
MNGLRLAAACGAIVCTIAFGGPGGAADATAATSIVDLGSDKWCRNRPGPNVTVKAATQVQEWCDPGNNELLQVDIFVKKANGEAGDYVVSYRNFLCGDVTSDRVRDRLC